MRRNDANHKVRDLRGRHLFAAKSAGARDLHGAGSAGKMGGAGFNAPREAPTHCGPSGPRNSERDETKEKSVRLGWW